MNALARHKKIIAKKIHWLKNCTFSLSCYSLYTHQPLEDMKNQNEPPISEDQSIRSVANRQLEAIENYAVEHSATIDRNTKTLLRELDRKTHLQVLLPQMLSGNFQGEFLSFFATLLRPKRILEIGTFTGYSAICFAQGLADGGHLHTIEINDELEPIIREYLEKAGVENKVTLHIGNALEIIPSIEGTFDLVFIDADKLSYSKYYDMVIERLNPRGLILIDNVLWSGKVLRDKKDKKTTVIHTLNQRIAADERVMNFLLPIRDGVMLVQRRG